MHAVIAARTCATPADTDTASMTTCRHAWHQCIHSCELMPVTRRWLRWPCALPGPQRCRGSTSGGRCLAACSTCSTPALPLLCASSRGVAEQAGKTRALLQLYTRVRKTKPRPRHPWCWWHAGIARHLPHSVTLISYVQPVCAHRQRQSLDTQIIEFSSGGSWLHGAGIAR